MQDFFSDQDEVDLEDAENVEVKNSAGQLLADWANTRDGWIRRLVALVLATRSPIDAGVVDEIYEHYLAEKGLSDASAEEIPSIQLTGATVEDGSVLKLLGLGEIQGVNALASGQSIAFNEGITVIFGENGAGKTGYTRILKRIAKARSAETIIRNVHDASPVDVPVAEISWAVDGVSSSATWANEEGLKPLDRMDVFDAPSTLMHLDSDLRYAYTPADLALYQYVTDAIGRVSDLASNGMDTRKPQGNVFLQIFERTSSAYPFIETLGATTDLVKLAGLAELSDKEVAELAALHDSVAALQGDNVQAQLTVATNRGMVNSQILALAKVLEGMEFNKYNQTLTDLKAAKEAQRILKLSFSEHHAIPGADSDEWHALITASDEYRKHLELESYPSDGDSCLYCRQVLSPDALKLIRTYMDLANNAGQLLITQSIRILQELTSGVLAYDLGRLERDIAATGDALEGDDHMAAAAKLIEETKTLRIEMDAKRPLVSNLAATMTTSTKMEATTRIGASEKLVAELKLQSTDRETKLSEARTKLLNLKARVQLKENLSDIRVHVENAKWAEALRTEAARIPSTLTSLTSVAKQASNLLLNNNFDARFQEECLKLRAPAVQLNFPGRKGESRRVKTVTSHKPSAILSEGEQKVIAMADFLAESSLRRASSPVIFDDPVNSLDYRRIGEVSSRIASLAEDRQVIVFTHNIWFATELLSRFEKKTNLCSYFSIQEDGPLKGIVSSGSHPRWDTVKKMTGKVNAILQSAKAATGETRDALVEKGYSLMRSWCEVVVEQELLQQVVQRYQPNVMLTKLSSIDGQKLDEAKKVIVPIYEKACRIMDGHSQPLETLSVRPRFEELEAEWKQLQGVR